MIGLLSALGWLRKAIDTVLAIALRYPLHAALLASLAANLWLWRGWEREQAGRAADRAVIAKAQAEAAARQAAADRANAAAQTERNRQVEHAHAQTELVRAAAVRDYIARHPVGMCRKGAQGGTGGAGQAGVPADPAEPDRAAGASDMVAVSAGDLDRLSKGYLRGAECTGFLKSLVEAGLARVGDASDGDRTRIERLDPAMTPM